MEKDKERLKVIDNIKEAVANGNFNIKVENDDPIVTDQQREDIILKYDIFYHKISKKIKRLIARRIVNNYTKFFNYDTEIVGKENLENIDGGAIITCNHFNVMDSTIIRKLMIDLKKEKKSGAIRTRRSPVFRECRSALCRKCSAI